MLSWLTAGKKPPPAASTATKRKETPSLERRKPLSPCGNLPRATAAAVGAAAKKPAEISEEPAGYYGRSKSTILSAVTHAQSALLTMSDSEVEAQGAHFFLQTPFGPMLCVDRDSQFFKVVQLRCFKEQVDELCIERAHAPIFPVLVPKKSELSARAPGPQVGGKSGTSFWNRFKRRTRERDTYPIQCYDYDRAIMFPYLLLNNVIGAIAENRLILHTYMRDKHPKGERQIGVNKRVEDGPFGGRVYSCLRVGILYWNPTQSSIKTLVEYDALLDKFKYVPPKKGLSTGNIKSYFEAKSNDVEEIIENNLFPER